MNRLFVFCVAVLFGIPFLPAQADKLLTVNVMRAAAPTPPQAQPPAPPSTPTPAPQPPTVKCPPAKADSAAPCNTPCQKICPTVVVYPAYSYPVYSYPVYDYGTSSRATYHSEERPQSDGIPYEDDYWKRGRDWGQDLRRGIVEFDDFLAFLTEEIVSAPESLRVQFQKGFAEGYGLHAAKAFEKAFELATKQGAKTEQPSKRVE